jgi:hypothetical protein
MLHMRRPYVIELATQTTWNGTVEYDGTASMVAKEARHTRVQITSGARPRTRRGGELPAGEVSDNVGFGVCLAA